MAEPQGFLQVHKQEAPKRPVAERIHDWREIYVDQTRPSERRRVRPGAALHGLRNPVLPLRDPAGCPLGNLIPEWNDLVRRGRWVGASDRLHATNNFPEFTGRVCPAPCEAACVLVHRRHAHRRQRDDQADRGGHRRRPPGSPATVVPKMPMITTGSRVAVVGSGPAGLAAAQQLTRAGHDVTVYERDDRLGGLLRYGIPEFKMEKAMLDQRLMQMRAEGTHFVTDCEVGVDLTVEQLRANFDAVVLAVGALLGPATTRPSRAAS